VLSSANRDQRWVGHLGGPHPGPRLQKPGRTTLPTFGLRRFCPGPTKRAEETAICLAAVGPARGLRPALVKFVGQGPRGYKGPGACWILRGIQGRGTAPASVLGNVGPGGARLTASFPKPEVSTTPPTWALAGRPINPFRRRRRGPALPDRHPPAAHCHITFQTPPWGPRPGRTRRTPQVAQHIIKGPRRQPVHPTVYARESIGFGRALDPAHDRVAGGDQTRRAPAPSDTSRAHRTTSLFQSEHTISQLHDQPGYNAAATFQPEPTIERVVDGQTKGTAER